jgi:hypothetical protein
MLQYVNISPCGLYLTYIHMHIAFVVCAQVKEHITMVTIPHLPTKKFTILYHSSLLNLGVRDTLFTKRKHFASMFSNTASQHIIVERNCFMTIPKVTKSLQWIPAAHQVLQSYAH